MLSSSLPAARASLVRAAASSASAVGTTTPLISCSDAAAPSDDGGRRWKHSSRQAKRLFKQNPARLRAISRKQFLDGGDDGEMGVSPNNVESLVDVRARDILQKWEKEGHVPQTRRQRTYERVFIPKFLSNNWSAPPGENTKDQFVEGVDSVPEYPFRVRRTGNKPNGAAGFLPVYSDIRVHGTKRTTQIKKVTGDVDAFLRELCVVLNLPPPETSVDGVGFSYGKSSSLSSPGAILGTGASAGIGAIGDVTASTRNNTSMKERSVHGGGEAGRGVSIERPVRIRAGGVIEIRGGRGSELRRWLAGLGF